MSQVNINLNTNQVEINTTNNQIVVTDPTNPTTVNITQPITSIVEVITAGPQGSPGPPGTGSIINTGSFVTTSSFNTYTGSSTSQFFGTSSYALTASFNLNDNWTKTGNDIANNNSGIVTVNKQLVVKNTDSGSDYVNVFEAKNFGGSTMAFIQGTGNANFQYVYAPYFNIPNGGGTFGTADGYWRLTIPPSEDYAEANRHIRYSTDSLALPYNNGDLVPKSYVDTATSTTVTEIGTATTYTPIITDDIIRSTTNQNVIITIPTNSLVDFPIGHKLFICKSIRNGNGFTIVASGGVTLEAPQGLITTADGTVSCVKTATNTWSVTLDLLTWDSGVNETYLGTNFRTGVVLPSQVKFPNYGIGWIGTEDGLSRLSFPIGQATIATKKMITEETDQSSNYTSLSLPNLKYVTGLISGSSALTASNAISSSFATTSSYAFNAATASNILGGKATHVPFFITDTTLATSSIYQSGSTSIIINQDANTEANPEALYVWQPHPTSINVISGKGNINNYLQLNIQNTNQGTSGSSDVVATANNGDEFSKFIDMGINGENYIDNGNGLGASNDGYLYSTGNKLYVGNGSNNSLVLFAGGTQTSTHQKILIDPNNQHQITGSVEISGSLNIKNNLTSSGLLTNGTNTVLGNTVMSGSSTIQGTTTMTGSLRITGSTTQVGNNTLLGNTILTGSIIVSSSYPVGSYSSSVNIYGDTSMTGFLKFNPQSTNIDTSLSASYIYVSGSTNDLYFAQNGNGYANTTRLRWLEGNLYTGLLHGGLISTQSSTVYQVSSGSGIVVTMNASLSDDPYPTTTFVNWPTLSASIAPLSASYDQSFISIQSNGTLYVQGTPYDDGQFNTLIPIGNVIHQNRSTINATATYPSVAYAYKQRSSDFLRAFGALKLSGLNTIVSGSSTGSISITSGTAYSEGRNYVTDPNNPSYVIETGQPISKIFRYYQSGSGWVYLTNGGAGYGAIDPTQYSNNGVLTAVPGTGINRQWTIQRVYYFPGGATKGIYVYYGNQTYASQIEAIANIPYETFAEAPNTTAGAILSAYLIVRNNADFTVADSYNIQQAGLFRNIGGSGGGGSVATNRLVDLSDVSIVSPANNNLLAYNSSTLKWENVSTITANVTGNLTGTASFASTASYIDPTFISASAAASGFGSGGGGSTSGLLTTASFNAYTSSNTSQFAGTASFATTAQTLLGSVETAQTASYATNFTVASTLQLDATLIDYSTVSSTIVGGNNLYTRATGSYTATFMKYTVSKGTNSRAGEFIVNWNDSLPVETTDVSTKDIGSTVDIVFDSVLVGGNIEINANAASSGWKIKSLATFI